MSYRFLTKSMPTRISSPKMYVSVTILLVMFAIVAKHLNNSKSDEKFMVKNVTINKFEIYEFLTCNCP